MHKVETELHLRKQALKGQGQEPQGNLAAADPGPDLLGIPAELRLAVNRGHLLEL